MGRWGEGAVRWDTWRCTCTRRYKGRIRLSSWVEGGPGGKGRARKVEGRWWGARHAAIGAVPRVVAVP